MNLYKKFCDKVSSPSVNAAVMMSGGGSNARNILANKELYPNINFVAMVTDQNKSNARSIAKEYGIEYICLEGKVKQKHEREKYFNSLAKLLEERAVDILLYAGFMKIVTDSFLQQFPGINSHPADLRVVDASGRIKYVGMDAVKLSLEDGQKELRCSCCLVENPVDSGRLIAVSQPVEVMDQAIDPENMHLELKKAEWYYYPRVIQKLTTGELNARSKVYLFVKN